MKITETAIRRIIREALGEGSGTIPVEWLTKEVLDDLGNAYMSNALPKTELGSVIWDKLNELGMETWSEDNPNGTWPSIADLKIEPGSHFHRWIVLDAVSRAEAEPQPDPRSVAAIEATKVWVADPTERNQRAAYYAGIRADDAAEDAMDYAYSPYTRLLDDYEEELTELLQGAKGLAMGAAAAFNVFNLRAAHEYITDRVTIWGVVPEEVRLRFRVLAALDAVGILPAPRIEAP